MIHWAWHVRYSMKNNERSVQWNNANSNCNNTYKQDGCVLYRNTIKYKNCLIPIGPYHLTNSTYNSCYHVLYIVGIVKHVNYFVYFDLEAELSLSPLRQGNTRSIATTAFNCRKWKTPNSSYKKPAVKYVLLHFWRKKNAKLHEKRIKIRLEKEPNKANSVGCLSAANKRVHCLVVCVQIWRDEPLCLVAVSQKYFFLLSKAFELVPQQKANHQSFRFLKINKKKIAHSAANAHTII